MNLREVIRTTLLSHVAGVMFCCAYAQNAAPKISSVSGAGTSLLSPGAPAIVYGSGFGTQPSVLIGGLTSTLYTIQSTQIIFQVPLGVPVGPSSVIVQTSNGSSSPFSVSISPFSPSISLVGSSSGLPSTLFADAALNQIPSPSPGDQVSLIVNGIGTSNPSPPTVLIDGQAIQALGVTPFQTSYGSGPTFTAYLVTFQLPVSLKGGTHMIAVQAGSQVSPPVSFTLFANGITLSQTGLTFKAVEGGSNPPPQSISVLSGLGTIPFTVSYNSVTGQPFLSATPLSGTAVAGQPGVPLTVNVTSAGLKAGVYYGLVQVASPQAPNSPQSISVVLTVAPAGSNLGATLDKTGLVFVNPVAGSSTAKQIMINNTTAATLSFTAALTGPGASAFAFTPPSATLNPGQTIPLQVQTNAGTVSQGVYMATLALTFSDGSVRTINLLLVIAPGAPTAADSGVRAFPAVSGSCTPTMLLPVFTQLGSNFSVPAAWPTPIEVSVVDDCGVPLSSGSVSATFSNGDPALTLSALRNGVWATTWPPLNAKQATVSIFVTARQPSTNIQGTAQLTGGVQANPSVPVLNQGGVVESAAYGQQPAPGSLIDVFGLNVASGQAGATTLPLPSQLLNTKVLLAGKELPLVFTNTGQVNAVLPYDLPSNSKFQVILQNGPSISVPQTIGVMETHPAVFTVDSSGKGQGHIYRTDSKGNAILATPASPAKAGDILVVYCTGLGAVTPNLPAGLPAPLSLLTYALAPVTVQIGNFDAHVVFAGLTPGFVGLYQVNVAVPANLPAGVTSLVITAGTQASSPVTFGVGN